MQCPICRRTLGTGPIDRHHKNFPRTAKWVRRLPKEEKHKTVLVHVQCHKDQNAFWLGNCVQGSLERDWIVSCKGFCQYTEVCCYYKRARGFEDFQYDLK